MHRAVASPMVFMSILLLILFAILTLCFLKYLYCQNKIEGLEDFLPVTGTSPDADDDVPNYSITNTINVNQGVWPRIKCLECQCQELITSVIITPSSAAPSITSNSLPFPKHGIKVSFLVQFIQSVGRANLGGKTTTDVCNEYIKPATQMSQLSYCELLTSRGDPAVGKARVFISHAWKYLFLDVVSALENHFSGAMDTIIWFDLFSNNQHKAVDLDFSWWCGTFQSAIKEFNHTVMILTPWKDPIPLTRGWCIFELYCTNVTNSKIYYLFIHELTLIYLHNIQVGLMLRCQKMPVKNSCEIWKKM